MIKAFLSISTALAINLFASEKPLLNFIKTVDWEFMGDKTEFTLDLCKCDNGAEGAAAGLRATLAEPIFATETTNDPWNLVGLGIKLDKTPGRKRGVSRITSEDEDGVRRYLHTIAFAPLGIMNFVQDSVCFERLSGASFLYWSEIIPSQTNDIVALFAQASKGPLSKIWYNNLIGMMACSVDCSATLFDKTINSLHWCAGCLGVTGNNTSYGSGKQNDPITAHHVFTLSALDDLHYSGIMAKVSNANFTYSPVSKVANSMCEPKYFPLAIKSQYYLQLAYPTVWDTTVIGKFRGSWAEFKNKPNSDDDVMTWGWVIKDTCVGGAKCKSFFTKDTN